MSTRINTTALKKSEKMKNNNTYNTNTDRCMVCDILKYANEYDRSEWTHNCAICKECKALWKNNIVYEP